MDDKILEFYVKAGLSYKNKGFSLKRDGIVDLIPKSDYEKECDVIIDGIPVNARLNVVPRIFFKNNNGIVDYLKELHDENPKQKIKVELLLNKDNTNQNPIQDSLNSKISDLEKEIKVLKSELKDYKSKYENLKYNTSIIADDIISSL